MGTPTHRSLINLMAHYKVSVGRVAQILQRSEATVRHWRAKSGTLIPEDQYQKLAFYLQAQSKRYTKTPRVAGRLILHDGAIYSEASGFRLAVHCPYCGCEHFHNTKELHQIPSCDEFAHAGHHPDRKMGYNIIPERDSEVAE